MSSLLRYLREFREAATPLQTTSSVGETGQLTPHEFVLAGDFLCERNPLFSWQKASSGSTNKSYLPADKQYLWATKLPSYSRVADLDDAHLKQVASNLDEEGYCLPMSSRGQQRGDEGDDIVFVFDEKLNIEEYEEKEKERASSEISEITSNTIQGDSTRYYNFAIVYDKYYRVPRVFFYGCDKNGSILSADAVFDDVFRDYSHKTVTLEPMPASGQLMLSIHPCQHAKAMLNVVKSLIACDSDYTPQVEHYLLIFLKVIQCMVPTIEYDYSFDALVAPRKKAT